MMHERRRRLLFVLCLMMLPAMVVLAQSSFLIQESRRTINGVRLYCKTMGRGEPIVVIHGGPGLDHAYFLPYLGRLSSHYRLVFFDQRASGQSAIPKDTSAMALANFVEDIEGIRKTFRLNRIHLLAHSWGAILALRYALKYPEHLKSLILVTPVPASSSYYPQAAKALADRVSGADIAAIAKLEKTERFQRRTAGVLEDWFRLYLPSMLYNRADTARIFLNFPRDYWAKSRMLRYLGPEATRFDYFPQLDSLTTPTLVIGAEADATPIASLQRVRETLPDAKLVILKKSGHFPFAEQPEAFFSALLPFLRDHR